MAIVLLGELFNLSLAAAERTVLVTKPEMGCTDTHQPGPGSVYLIEKSTLDLFLNACVPHPLPYIMSKTSVFDWSFLIT